MNLYNSGLVALLTLTSSFSIGQDPFDEVTASLTRGLSVEINNAAAGGNVQTPAKATSRDGNITLTLNKRIFQKNDHLTVKVQVKKDCWVRLFHKGVDGSITQIFPNNAQSDNKVRAGVPVTIPGPYSGFKFRVHEPWGDEMILAVATFKQLYQDEYKPKETFKTYKSAYEVQQCMTRGLSVAISSKTTTNYKPPTNAYKPPTNNYKPPTNNYTPPKPAYTPPKYKETVSTVSVAFRIQPYY